MSFRKLIAFVALMVFASQGAMAAPKPSLHRRAAMPLPSPPDPRGNIEARNIKDIGAWIIPMAHEVPHSYSQYIKNVFYSCSSPPLCFQVGSSSVDIIACFRGENVDLKLVRTLNEWVCVFEINSSELWFRIFFLTTFFYLCNIQYQSLGVCMYTTKSPSLLSFMIFD